MASSNEEFLKILACPICLEKFETPKTLACSHDFCKDCLEKMLNFQPDGSAWITCPMRCPDKTFIPKDQVVDGLPTSITLKNMAHVVIKDKTVLGPVCRMPGCEHLVSYHCCGIMRCEACQKKHDGGLRQHDGRAQIAFSEKDNKLNVLCPDHSSICTHLCVDDKLLCVYCLARNADHKQHAKNTLETETRLIREALDKELKDSLASMKAQEHYRRLTEDGIVKIKNSFKAIMKGRKEFLLKWYRDFLDSEMEILTKKLDALCEEHLGNYPADMSEYYEDKLKLPDVDLVLQKEEIVVAINTRERTCKLQCDTISASGEMDFLSFHPLGDIEMIDRKTARMDEPPYSTLDCNFKKAVPTAKMLPNGPKKKEKNDVLEVLVLPSSNSVTQTTPVGCKGKNFPFRPHSTNDLSVGMKISVNRGNGRFSRGTVKWIGTLPKHGCYVGLELDGERGRNDGTLNGIEYFTCQRGYALFVKFSKVVMAWN